MNEHSCGVLCNILEVKITIESKHESSEGDKEFS